jgi:hypothetical protein
VPSKEAEPIKVISRFEVESFVLNGEVTHQNRYFLGESFTPEAGDDTGARWAAEWWLARRFGIGKKDN